MQFGHRESAKKLIRFEVNVTEALEILVYSRF